MLNNVLADWSLFGATDNVLRSTSHPGLLVNTREKDMRCLRCDEREEVIVHTESAFRCIDGDCRVCAFWTVILCHIFFPQI